MNKATAELFLDAAFVTAGKYKGFADFKLANDGTLFAVKTLSADGFRALFQRNAEDKEWTQVETNGAIKNSVNEYGGAAFSPLTKSNYAYTSGQSIFWNANSSIHELTRPGCHFADLNFVDRHLFCVVEDRSGNDSKQSIGRFDLEKPNSFEVIAKGYDFYGTPRLSPDGKHLVYTAWEDPNMPWDATSIHLVDLSTDPINDIQVLPADEHALTNYQSVQWNANNESFYFVSDESGFWSIYEYSLKTNHSQLIAAVEGQDLAEAVWNVGDDHFYAANSKLIVYRDGTDLYAKCLSSGHVHSIGSSEFTQYSRLYINESNVVYCIASGPLQSETLIEIKVHGDGKSDIRVIDRILNTDELKAANIEPFKSIVYNVSDPENGQQVSIEGFYYAPINQKFGDKPPLIMMAHAGPTTQTSTSLDKKKLFYRSKGFAIFDVNYRGSTGYGRQFRDLLYNNWGEVDVVDVCEGAKHLIELGLVDKDKIFIIGSSATGYTVLRALYKEPQLFKAAVCSYGFSDLFELTAETHRFEKAYNYHLISPETEKQIWQARNMSDKLDKIVTPMALYHGSDDRVVPYKQSEQIHKFLVEKGIRTQLEIFEGEGHGFRQAENVEKVLNGTLKFFYEAMGVEEVY